MKGNTYEPTSDNPRTHIFAYEPWQKLSNRNPERRVLATAVISKDNKGTGEAEPFAFTTEMGKGRCFNLVLGHDARALNTAGCTALILRGSEWAATGAVK